MDRLVLKWNDIGVAHISLKRFEMPPWAEQMASQCSSMQGVRDQAKKVDDDRVRAMTEVQEIEAKLVRASAEGEQNACHHVSLAKI